MNRVLDYCRLMRLDKPIGILLLLWPTLSALWLAAHGSPSLSILIIFVVGVVIMRTAGDIINDIADRHIDGFVQRTQSRPLATQAISLNNAWLLFSLLIIAALALVLFLNRFTLYLSVLGLGLACLYPFTKRFTHWPQAFLGLAYSWGIPLAFAAENNQAPPMLAWWLFATVGLWVMVYDTFYAMVDRADDIKIGVKSTAVLFGNYDRLITGCLQMVVLVSFWLIGRYCQLGVAFYLGWGVALGLAIYQQYLIRNREPSACFRAFLNNHWFGCAIFCGFFLGT